MKNINKKEASETLSAKEEKILKVILKTQFKTYRSIMIQDIYKLFFQAAMGCEHAAADEKASFEILKKEITEMKSGPSERLFDTISPDGKIIRINLRPYIEAGGNIEILNIRFIKSASAYKGSIKKLLEFWCWFMEHQRVIPMEFTKAALSRFIKEMEKNNYPAVHHSSEYRKSNSPAYRVVLKDLIWNEIQRIS